MNARTTAPHESRRWYRMQAEPDTRTAEIFIYDVIGGWFYGVDAASLVRDLADLDVDEITVRVNSPGGAAFDGIAIMNALHRHKARIIATVDGLAASAASVIIQAADEVVMGRGSELMIHDASNYAWGNAADLRNEADSLDKLSGAIAGIYAERAGGTPEEWRTAMLAETWYTAEEAVTAGLADRVEGTESSPDPETEPAESEAFNMAAFAHAGRSAAPPPYVPATAHRAASRPSRAVGAPLTTAIYITQRATHKPPAEPEETTTPTQEGAPAMSDALTQGIRQRLGIPADQTATDDDILAAVDKALAVAPTTTPDPASAEPAPGTVLVDATAFAELRANAEAGRQAREAQLTAERTALLDGAVADGRIPPSARDGWEKSLMVAPEETAKTLAGLTPGVVPLAPVGYTGGVDESSDEGDRLYSKVWASPNTKEA